MVQDAESHAEEDKKYTELVSTKNNAEAMVNTVRKTLTEAGDKVEASEKEKVEAAIKDVEEALKSDDKEKIEASVNALMTASQKISEMLYKDAGAEASANPGPEGAEADGSAKHDDVIDAEYTEEAKEEKRD